MRAIIQFRDVEYYEGVLTHEGVTEVSNGGNVIIVHQLEGATFYPIDVVAHITVER